MMAERNQFSAGVGSGIYGSGESVGNIVFPPTPSGLTGGAPAAPANLVASNGEYTDKILLTWGIVSGATKYKIYRNLNLLVETTGTPDTNNNISYDDTSAVPGILYTYVVTAVNNTGESSQSNSDTGSRKLSVPSSISVSQNTYKDKINLSWSSVNGAESYILYKGSENSTDNMIYLIETTETHYSDINSPGANFYYSIISSSDIGEANSDYSTPSYGSVDPIPETPIVTATKGTYSDKIELTWNTIITANSYDIYRDSSLIESTVATMYSDTSATPGVSHTYYVLANSSTGTSIYTTDSGDTGSMKLEFPNGVVASYELYENKITVSWNQTTGATGYKIYRGTSPVNPGLNMTLVATVDSSTFSYDDTNTDLSYAVNYYYCIKAFCTLAEDESNFSNPALGILKTPTPAQTTGLSASQGTYSDKVALTWNAVTNASSYLIYRDGVQIATSSTNSYDDTTGATSYCQSYTYYVKAINNFGNTGTASSSVTGYKALQTPTGLTATDSQFLSKIVVTWNSVPAATSYTLYRGTTSSTGSMSIIASGLTSPSYDDTNTDLVNGTRYYYAVKATCALNTTGFSNVDSGILDTPTVVIPAPNTPTGLTASDGSSTSQVTLAWSAVTSTPLSGYKIFRNGSQIGTTTLTSFSDTPALGAVPGTQYTYTVKAYNTYGDSSASSSDTGYIKLSAPTGLSASRGISESTISLNWSASQGATSYKIYRSSDAVTYSQIDTTTNTNYTDTNTDLSYDTVYYYKLKASGSLAAAESAYGNPYYGYLKPPVPQSFTMTASDGTDSTGVVLSWTASQYAYGGYKIYRDGVPIADARANYFKYSSTLDRLATGLGWSSYTSGGSGQLFATSSKVMPDSSTNGTKITFASDTNNGFYQQIPSVEENTYYIASIYAGTESGSNNFRISYFDGSTSTFSGSFTATTTMQRFSWIFKTKSGNTQAQNFLSNVAFGNDAGTGGTVVFWGAQLEKVESASDTVSSYIQTTTAPVVRTTHTDTSANIETIYTYKVRALNASGFIDSNTNTGFRLTPAPVITNITKTDTSKIDLTIITNAGTNSTLKIYRGLDSNTNDSTNTPNYAEIASIAVTGATMTYSDNTSLQTGKKYYYRARTVYNSANSDYSNEEYGQIVPLSAPTSASDYTLWAYAWASGEDNPDSIYNNPNPAYRLGSGSYAFKGIVPQILSPTSTTGSSANYNGSRYPSDLTYNPTTTGWNTFKNRLNLVPSNRRVVLPFHLLLEFNPYTLGHVNYYKNTSDGTTYNGSKFLTPWYDQNLQDAKTVFKLFLNKCNTDGVTFDYISEDKESWHYFTINGTNHDNNSLSTTSVGFNSQNNPPVAKAISPPADLNNSYYVRDGGQVTQDARVISAIIADSRFNTKKHPVTGKTFAEEFVDNFKAIWSSHWLFKYVPFPSPFPTAEQILSPYVGITDPVDFKKISNYWSFYSCTNLDMSYSVSLNNGLVTGTCPCAPLYCSYCGPVGRNINNVDIPPGYSTFGLKGYHLFHMASPAWEATLKNWIFGYYTKNLYIDTMHDTNYTNFNNVKLLTYENIPSSAAESSFFQQSNLDPYYQPVYPNVGYGIPYYGWVGNIDYAPSNIPADDGGLPITSIPGAKLETRLSTTNWKSTHGYRSGYVKNPQNDYERYAFVGYGEDGNPHYGGASCGTGNIVQYPEISMVDTATPPNWVPSNINKFRTELAYKVVVKDVRQTRFVLRSDSNYKENFVPYIAGPAWNAGGTDRSNLRFNYGYWIEQVFHIFLHSPKFFSHYNEKYDTGIGQTQAIQFVLDHWRTITLNSTVLPCSNSTGSTSTIVDRLNIPDAFEKYTMSGARITNTGKYLWRISVPPKFFDPVTGIATLDRVGTDSDIPATITIDSKNDVVPSVSWETANVHNSRGVWITRSVSTPPNYTPRPV